MSGKKKSNGTSPTLNLHGATQWDFHHRWEVLMGGLRFITIWRAGEVLAVSSEADFYVESFVAMKNAGLTSGHDDLVDADWVHKWGAFLDHFSVERGSRWEESYDRLSDEQRSYEAVLSAFAFVRELEKRSKEGFSWADPVEAVIDERAQQFGMNVDESRVVRMGGSDV